MGLRYKHTPEAKQKIKEARKKQIMPPASIETRKKMSTWQTGKHLSVETKDKISKANTGRIKTEKEKKDISERMKGKKITLGMKFPGRKLPPVSIETRNKMSESHRGNKSYSWKGGISEENHIIRKGIENRLWRESVFARDNWTCQKTGQIGGKLRCHHIKNFAQYPELRFAIDNGITLSDESHKEFHKIYGIKNNTQEQINEYIYGKI